MKIELDEAKLGALLRSGLIHPSDVRCLDVETKRALQKMCLSLCKPRNCINCNAQDQCAALISMMQLTSNLENITTNSESTIEN